MVARASATAQTPYANEDLNRVVNTAIKLRLGDYNATVKGCKPEKLYEFLKEDFDNNFPAIYKYSRLNVPIVGPASHEKLPYKLPAGKGVCSVRGSFKAPYNSKSYSPSIKVQAKGKTFFVGLDKIDHFFSHSYHYWKMTEEDPTLPPEKIQRMLDLGMDQEDGIWGLKCYSVKSYGDLAANYHGVAFWRDLLKGSPPLIACENGKYVQKNQFDIAKYINASMDESVNCNSYDSQEVLNALSTEWNKAKLKCPADENECANLRKSLPPEVAKKILHPRCLGTGTAQVETPEEITSQDYLDAVSILILNKQVPPRPRATPKQEAVTQ